MVGKCFANVQWGPLAQNGCHLGPEWWRQTGATWGPKVVAPNRCHRFLPSSQGMRKKTSCVFLGGAIGQPLVDHWPAVGQPLVDHWPTIGKRFLLALAGVTNLKRAPSHTGTMPQATNAQENTEGDMYMLKAASANCFWKHDVL